MFLAIRYLEFNSLIFLSLITKKKLLSKSLYSSLFTCNAICVVACSSIEPTIFETGLPVALVVSIEAKIDLSSFLFAKSSDKGKLFQTQVTWIENKVLTHFSFSSNGNEFKQLILTRLLFIIKWSCLIIVSS